MTGGTGGIGSGVARLLLTKGYEVVVYDVSPLRAHNKVLEGFGKRLADEVGSVTEMGRLIDVIKAHDVKGIIHLAGMLPPHMNNIRPIEALSVNVIGTATVLEAARILGLGPVIVASAAGVMGRAKDVTTPRAEEDVSLPLVGIYPVSKLVSEQLVYTYRQLYRLNTTAVRPRNGYGPGTSYRVQPLYDVVYDAVAGKDVVLKAGGASIFDYTYVKDLAKGIVQLYELKSRPPRYVYNLARGQGVTMAQVFEVVHKIFPQLRIQVGPGPWEGVVEGGRELDLTVYPAVMPLQDISRAREDFGFEPLWGIERGVADWVRWLQTGEYGEY